MIPLADVPPSVGRALAMSRFTDPGPFAPLLLPETAGPPDLAAVGAIVKAQLIHPYDAHRLGRGPARRAIAASRATTTVEAMLAGLQRLSSAGLTLTRPPAARLVLPCDHHALLTAAMLKAAGVPCRLRAGFASYLVPRRLVPHVVCEVWRDGAWQAFDPERRLGELPSGGFTSGARAWVLLRAGALDPAALRDWRYRGLAAARLKLFVDAGCLMNAEMAHYEWLRPRAMRPRLLAVAPARLSRDDRATLDRLAVSILVDTLDERSYASACA